jgi:hypothetical protein
MNTNYLETDLDWLVYADYLDDQNINHFIREEVTQAYEPWTWEKTGTGIGGSVGDVGSQVDFLDYYESWASYVGAFDGVGSKTCYLTDQYDRPGIRIC